MAITVEDSGSQTATVSTEHTLSTLTTNKTFMPYVDCNALAAGEYVELKVKRKARSSDTERIYQTMIVSWLQSGVTPLVSFPPIAAGDSDYVLTLKQLNGTGRAFPWAIETPG